MQEFFYYEVLNWAPVHEENMKGASKDDIISKIT